jgi:beta-lactamase family protein
MRTRSSLTILTSAALGVFATRTAMAACSDPLPLTGAYDAHFSSLDSYVQQWLDSNQVSAATLAITYDKRLVYERGFGYENATCTEQILPDARMRLATNSTAMTRRALQQLIADGALTATTNVQQYLSGFFTLSPSAQEPRLQEIRVQDIYNFTTCTSDANYITNVQVGINENLGREATATERIQYMWANPQYIMPPSTAGCTPGPSALQQFSHVSHEVAGAIIAAAYYKLSGHGTFNDPNLISATGVGQWYGSYVQSVVGAHTGGSLWQASDDEPNAPGSPIPDEIWYDSAGATACPEWNYFACTATPPTQLPVPVAYATDFYARPGSGTVVSSARDAVRFMNYYHWAGRQRDSPEQPDRASTSWMGLLRRRCVAGNRQLSRRRDDILRWPNARLELGTPLQP